MLKSKQHAIRSLWWWRWLWGSCWSWWPSIGIKCWEQNNNLIVSFSATQTTSEFRTPARQSARSTTTSSSSSLLSSLSTWSLFSRKSGWNFGGFWSKLLTFFRSLDPGARKFQSVWCLAVRWGFSNFPFPLFFSCNFHSNSSILFLLSVAVLHVWPDFAFCYSCPGNLCLNKDLSPGL